MNQATQCNVFNLSRITPVKSKQHQQDNIHNRMEDNSRLWPSKKAINQADNNQRYQTGATNIRELYTQSLLQASRLPSIWHWETIMLECLVKMEIGLFYRIIICRRPKICRERHYFMTISFQCQTRVSPDYNNSNKISIILVPILVEKTKIANKTIKSLSNNGLTHREIWSICSLKTLLQSTLETSI